MKVLYAAPARGIPVYGPSGASAHQRGVIAALAELGHQVTVLAGSVEDRRGRHGRLPEGVELRSAPEPGWPSWLKRYRERREAWHARRLAAAAGGPYDLIWERWSLFSDVGRRVRAATGARWILEVNAPLAQERARFEELFDPAWAETWERRVLPLPDLVVTVSTWLVRWLVEERGVPSSRVLLLPNGTAGGHGDRARGRAALGVDDAFVLGFLGSMKPWHGADRLERIVAQVPGAVGVAVGGGPVQPEGVRCLGGVDDPADLVAAMDIGLAPYPDDAPPWFCPLKIADYRAEGTPVVASAVGDLPALVGAGGTTVAASDDAAFAAACQRWRGRRAAPSVRSWGQVVEEALAAC